MAEIEKWIEVAKECKYLPENDLKVSIPVSIIKVLHVIAYLLCFFFGL